MRDPLDNPTPGPDEAPAAADGQPKFGRLLIVLVIAVLLVGALTYLSEAFYS